MHVRQRPFAPGDELDDEELLAELQRLLGGPLLRRRDPPAAAPGEVWFQRSWLVTAHRRARHWRGRTDHRSYAETSRPELLGELAKALGFDLRTVARSADARVEIAAVYEGLRELWEASERTCYREALVIKE